MSEATWWIDGEATDTLPLSDRAVGYGDGLFETIAVREGRARLIDYHLERLSLGAMRLAIPMMSEADIRAELSALLIRELPGGHGTAKLILTRGSSPRGYAPPRRSKPVLAMQLSPSERLPAAAPATVTWSGVRLARQTHLAGMKHLNRLEQVLASVSRSGTDCDELLLCDSDGHAVCGTMSNVFVVTGGILRTPALTHSGVAGIMRRFVLEQAHRVSLAMEVTALTPRDCRGAQELFLTNSQYGIRPVTRLQGLEKERGPVTDTMLRMLAAAGIAECDG